MQMLNPLCQTIRNRHRKIGRNEPCPCGRTREIEAGHILSGVKNVVVDRSSVLHRLIAPIKYKHCCGDIASKPVRTRAKHHITNVIRKALGYRKNRKSMLQKLASFFKKD